jgi:hypothetical protein
MLNLYDEETETESKRERSIGLSGTRFARKYKDVQRPRRRKQGVDATTVARAIKRVLSGAHDDRERCRSGVARVLRQLCLEYVEARCELAIVGSWTAVQGFKRGAYAEISRRPRLAC